MPEFYPEHDEWAEDNAFLLGYVRAAEWLWPEEIDRNRVVGWGKTAKLEMKRDCKAFMRANALDLAAYCEMSGRDMEHAGHDFFLSRNGHGAGYFDRGNGEVFDRLQKAARLEGSADCFYIYRRRVWL